LQIITFGEKEARLSFSLQETSTGEEVILRTIPLEAQKVDFTSNRDPIEIMKIVKPSRGDKRIKLEKFLKLLNEVTSQD
ncbi:MAG: hypothetical protein ACXACB_13940, partial [Promethearchaeota archaeon]